MSIELARTYVQIVPSMRGVQSEISGSFGAAGDVGGREAGTKARGGILKGAAAAGVGFLGAFGLASIAANLASGLGSAITDSIGYASDLNEAGTAVGAVFGKATADVNKFAQAGGKGLGQTQLDVLNAAKTFGVYGKAAGLSAKANASFSTDLVGLSTDLASFYNVDPSQAAEAIAAGLRGESEPLRQYGVLLDDATLKAEAMKQGTYSGTGTLSQQAKVLAAQAVILKQTTVAQGDFARTSGGLANQQRILSAQTQDLKGKLGAVLLPVVTAVVVGLNKIITPVGTLADKLPGLGSAARAGFGSVLQAIGPPVLAAIGLITQTLAPVGTSIVRTFIPVGQILANVGPQFLTLATSISPLGLVFRALLPVLPQIAGVLAVLAGVLGQTLQGVLVAIVPVVVQLSGVLLQVATSVLGVVVPAVAQLVTAIASSLQGVLVAILPAVTQLASVLGAALGQALTIIAPLLVNVGALFGTVVTQLYPVIAVVVKLAGQLIAQLLPVFVQLVRQVLPPVLQILGQLVGVITPIIPIIGTVLAGVIRALLPVIRAVFTAIVPIIKAAVQIITGVLDVVIGLIRGDFSQVWRGLGKIVSGAFNLVVGVIKGAVGIIGAAIKAVVDIVVTTFKGAVDLVVSVGGNIIDGLIQGMKANGQAVLDFIGSLIGNVVDFAKNLLGIHSPSRVFAQIGRFVAQGLADGLAGSQDQVQSASEKLVNGVTDAFAKLVSNREAAQKRLAKLNLQLSRVDTSTKAGRNRASDLKASIAEQKAAIAAAKAPGGTKGFVKALKADTDEIARLAGRRDRLSAQLKTAQDDLASAVKVRDDFRDQVRATVVGLGDVVASFNQIVDARVKAGEAVTDLTGKIADLGKSQADAQADVDSTQAQISALDSQLASLSRYGSDYADKIIDLQDERTDLAGQLATQLGKVADYASQTASVQNDLAKAQADAVQASSPRILSTLQAAITNTNAFRDTLATLRGQGLDDTTYSQLLQGGIAGGGLQAAQELAQAGPGVVQQVRDLQAQLATAGTALGTSASTVLYQAGVDTAQASVDGIKSKIVDNQAAIALLEAAVGDRVRSLGINTSTLMKGVGAQITAGLADGIDGAKSDLYAVINDLGAKTVTKLKKKLGIKSPSRVVRKEVGQQVGAGYVLGIEDMHSAAERASAGLASIPAAAMADAGFDLGAAPTPIQQVFNGPMGYTRDEIADTIATRGRRAVTGANIRRVRVA